MGLRQNVKLITTTGSANRLRITKLAVQISPHVFVRPGELRHAEWREIDLEGALWIIPGGQDKNAQGAPCTAFPPSG